MPHEGVGSASLTSQAQNVLEKCVAEILAGALGSQAARPRCSRGVLEWKLWTVPWAGGCAAPARFCRGNNEALQRPLRCLYRGRREGLQSSLHAFPVEMLRQRKGVMAQG